MSAAMKDKPPLGSDFQIRVPGSVANLGPGFDTLAVAVQLYLTLNVRVIGAAGPLPGELEFRFTGSQPAGENNIARAFHFLAVRYLASHPSLFVEVHSDIPVKAGLGSSAAATVAGMRLFEALAGELPQQELLAAATQLEGHPDNVAAALLGGLAICCQTEEGNVTALSRPWPESLEMLVLTPEFPLATERARAILPAQVAWSDAVGNLQRVALLLAAIESREFQHLREAFRDRLHQPYRQALVPGLQHLTELQHPSLLGVCLSGAGPSVVAFVEREASEVAALLSKAYTVTGLPFTIRHLLAHPTESQVAKSLAPTLLPQGSRV
jgi:homoserine kinase